MSTPTITPDADERQETVEQPATAATEEQTPQAEPTAEQTTEQATDQTAEQTEEPVQSETAETSAAPEAAEPAFRTLGLDHRVMAVVDRMGFTTPTAIQARTVPLMNQGRDVIGLAQTGTGKTAAFALPTLSSLAAEHDAGQLTRTPKALVLAPTRELALQVADAFSTYAADVDGVTVLPIYGGAPYGPQLDGLRRGAQVVVGTPGRVIDHMQRGSLDLSGIEHLVLDEADEMLRMGFAEEVDQILAKTPSAKQVALFSATMPKAIRRISADYLNDPVEVSVKEATSTSSTISQRYVQVKHHAKGDALVRIMETETQDGAIVFVRTRAATEEVAEKLTARGFRAAAINGDVPQKLREKTVENLRAGRVDVLVATDVAARGLDVERISHVYNYDIPMDTESYVHRIGRTGRAGRSGEAVLFVTPRERRMLRSIEKATRQKVEQMAMPTIADVNAARSRRFAERITAARQDGQIDQYREVVSSYIADNDVSGEDVAAALVAMLHEGRPLFDRDSGHDDLVREASREASEKPERGGRDRGPKGPAREAGPGKAMYRIAVGRRNGVNPGHIVGAIANEADLPAKDIGGIDIRNTHALVELPEQLSSAQWDALAKTRIGGELIELKKDAGGASGGRGGGAPRGGGRRDAKSGGFGSTKRKPRSS
ncbi:DEAD/DEAH box helicase [Nesterenkonia halophila]|uniref:DEAD/DEAH box helicase n=1 Tax=Nesterenkonia halophila TaxID=302044 RepID=UPI00129254B1|nr:DEAD/DEAH box helicase [Nesterenkonia halophila]